METKINKINKVYKRMICLTATMHFIFGLILWREGMRGFAVYNLFSMLFYLAMTKVVNKLLSGNFVSKLAIDYSEEDWNYVTIDEMTGMYNSKYFLKNVERILKESNEKYYFIYTDILNFSLYNKMFSEDKGDEILKEIAKMLKAMNFGTVVCGRMFVDEFGVLIPESAYDEKYLMECIIALQDKFSSSIYQVYIYGGIYEIKDNNESAKAMCIKAKIALDTIKGDYDKILAFYDENMLKENLMKQKIIGEFNEALQQEQFYVCLQPQVTAEGKLLGAEALVRWQHPEKGMISPEQFIPVLEETSLITMLDCYIWEQAAKLLQKWKGEGRDSIYISVNVSAMDFYYADIYRTFTSLVQKYDIVPGNLKIEITETVLMNDTVNQLKILERLRKYGFDIELDDFGSGYSSLSMLKDIMVDAIKIDMGFLDETTHEKRSWSILRSIVNMAEELGIRTITEGVKTEQQVKDLLDIGCKVFQGYYFAKPMKVEEFTAKWFQ